MSEIIKCPITDNQCMCDCNPEGLCFIDVKSDSIVRKMAQVAYDSSLDFVNDSQLSNVPTEFKLKIADRISREAKKRIGKTY